MSNVRFTTGTNVCERFILKRKRVMPGCLLMGKVSSYLHWGGQLISDGHLGIICKPHHLP